MHSWCIPLVPWTRASWWLLWSQSKHKKISCLSVSAPGPYWVQLETLVQSLGWDLQSADFLSQPWNCTVSLKGLQCSPGAGTGSQLIFGLSPRTTPEVVGESSVVPRLRLTTGSGNTRACSSLPCGPRARTCNYQMVDLQPWDSNRSYYLHGTVWY